jgi:hypothetical protein
VTVSIIAGNMSAHINIFILPLHKLHLQPSLQGVFLAAAADAVTAVEDHGHDLQPKVLFQAPSISSTPGENVRQLRFL